MKFAIVILAAIIGTACASVELESGFMKIFGRTTDLSGRPHQLIGIKTVNFAEDCPEDNLVKRIVDFEKDDAKIFGIRHIDFQPNESDVYVTKGGVGEKFATVKIYARCGHHSLLQFYGEYNN